MALHDDTGGFRPALDEQSGNSGAAGSTASAAEEDGIRSFLPSRAMCTDNAAMIASVGWHRLRSDGPTPLEAGANPNLRLQFA